MVTGGRASKHPPLDGMAHLCVFVFALFVLGACMQALVLYETACFKCACVGGRAFKYKYVAISLHVKTIIRMFGCVNGGVNHCVHAAFNFSRECVNLFVRWGSRK